MNREVGGTIAALLGLLLLIGAVNGTYPKLFRDLFNKEAAPADAGAASGGNQQSVNTNAREPNDLGG